MTTQVTVYHIGPACVQCNQTKKVMDKLGIPYTEVDLREHPEISKKFTDAGYKTAPIVTAGDLTWAGFKLEMIKGLAVHA